MTLIRVAAVQMEPRFREVTANLEVILGTTRQAAHAGAQLVAFPECALTGYCFDSKGEALDMAEPIPGPSTEAVASVCAEWGAFAVYGLLERDGQRLYNACALVGPEGVIGSYRKVHLPYMGVDRWANPGDRPFAVHEVAGVRVGMHICYDGAFPETGRVLTLLGADLLVLPTNWPTHSECAAEHMVACRAMENVVYMMAVNRVGQERGFRFIGRSSIADPTGAIIAAASPDAEQILYAEVDPARSRQKRLVRVPGKAEIDRITDRRPEFYGLLVEPRRRAGE
jgi:predicted amidohydrolase